MKNWLFICKTNVFLSGMHIGEQWRIPANLPTAAHLSANNKFQL